MYQISRSGNTETEIKGKTLFGYASVFDVQAEVSDYGQLALESIDRMAFEDVLADKRTVALFNHNQDFLLASTRNDSLKLSTDAQGLHYEFSLMDTQVARDVQAMAEAGLLGGASFKAQFANDSIQRGRSNDGLMTVHITRFSRLVDISVVTIPAYDDTSVAMRKLNVGISADNSNVSKSKLLTARHRARYKK